MELLGYYVPFRSRTQLLDTINVSSSCFSVKRTALQQVGGFSAFLSNRPNISLNVEVVDLCRRLRQSGYTLWYEPQAIIAHRVSRERMNRAFLAGRAYWRGRSEILADYAAHEDYPDTEGSSFFDTLRSLLPEIKELLQILLLYRLLLHLARRSMSERVYAALAQARCWGRIQQQFMLSNHAPATSHIPFVFIIEAHEHDAKLLYMGLKAQGTSCNISNADIPLAWLWRHRAYQETAIGIIHLYRPGAFNINYWQQQRLLWKLRLAQRLGIRIVSTDAGGWWNNVRHLQFLNRRHFERRIFSCSQLIHTFVRRPEHFYNQHKWYHRVCFLAHPGLRGALATVIEHATACTMLGLHSGLEFVYLCFADMHSEQEIIHVIEAFSEMRSLMLLNEKTARLDPQLVLVGTPRDKKSSQRILTRAALNPSLHVFLEYYEQDMPIYLGAANALVMPYSNVRSAGVADLAMLFYSYERLVIIPDLPRFHGLLPPYARLQFHPAHRTSLVQALLQAPSSEYHHTEKETTILNCIQGWKNYASHIIDTYRSLLTLP
jgi:hypothetical protein